LLGTVSAALLYAFWVAPSDKEGNVVELARPQRADGPRVTHEDGGSLGFARRIVAEVSTNLFASHSWYVAPPAPPPREAAPVVPTAPPLPYTYLGSYARTGEKPVFFLVSNDRVYNVHVGDVLEKVYSIDTAENGQLQMTYLPLGIKQSLQVGGTP
jgi:hypothetical protein